MKNMMEYRGYFGSVHFSNEDEVFYGKVEFIRSLINYEGIDVQSLTSSFHEAVDEYLEGYGVYTSLENSKDFGRPHPSPPLAKATVYTQLSQIASF